MDHLYNADEKELIRLAAFFKKQGERLKEENKLSEEYILLLQTCATLLEQMELHAKSREQIMNEHEQLKKLMNDNARCPQCEKSTHLKLAGTNKSPQGWVSNKYRCRKCNIEFVWNSPNNPWDMMEYVQHMASILEKRMEEEEQEPSVREQNEQALVQMKASLEKLRPVIDSSRQNLADLAQREQVMSEMVMKVKKHLLIEKIKMS